MVSKVGLLGTRWRVEEVPLSTAMGECWPGHAEPAFIRNGWFTTRGACSDCAWRRPRRSARPNASIPASRSTPTLRPTGEGGRGGHAGRGATAGTGGAALSTVYFDTEDLRLARSGITLRRRSGGSDDGWHLKLPAGSDARDEVRLPPVSWVLRPRRWWRSTCATHRGAPLVPVVELDTARREWVLADSDGDPLATVTDDRVTGQTLAAPTMVTRWAEIEVELAEHGTVEVLDRVEQALLAAGAEPRRVVVEARSDARRPVAAACSASRNSRRRSQIRPGGVELGLHPLGARLLVAHQPAEGEAVAAPGGSGRTQLTHQSARDDGVLLAE